MDCKDFKEAFEDTKREPMDLEPPDDQNTKPGALATKINKEERKFFEDTVTGIEENHPHHVNVVIKQEPESSADSELIKTEVQSLEVTLQYLPNYKQTDIKQEHEDVDQTDPDDVKTESSKELIPDGCKQLDIKEDLDIKYMNTQDYLDIDETVISEQDRAAPATSSPGPAKCKKEIGFNTSMEENISICESSYLEIHNKVPTGKKKLICDICSYSCNRKYNLKIHLMMHTKDMPYKCKTCDYQCTLNSNMKIHNLIHTGEKPYKCKACDYQCTQKSNLKMHNMIHTGEKPYKCNTCDYRCLRRSRLKQHNRVHTGEKPFKCEICDYQCAQKCHLKRHVLKHSGEKSYKCITCDYQTTNSSHLKRHNMIHTGEKPYICKICDYQSSNASHLKTHIMIHKKDKPYKCTTCDYQCKSSTNLRRHSMKHTRENP